ncbi:hypothetical protein CHELA41_24471 [Hyphomicrobiales bacterium]|nr:hypothetical protein CHELA41_24471 [Hyphomicrobiales bacterium]
MVHVLDKDQIPRIVVEMVSIEMMDVEPFSQFILKPFGRTIWVRRQPCMVVGL